MSNVKIGLKLNVWVELDYWPRLKFNHGIGLKFNVRIGLKFNIWVELGYFPRFKFNVGIGLKFKVKIGLKFNVWVELGYLPRFKFNDKIELESNPNIGLSHISKVIQPNSFDLISWRSQSPHISDFHCQLHVSVSISEAKTQEKYSLL